MGKGDKRTKKGKIRAGSYGVIRKRKSVLAKEAKDVAIKKAATKKVAPKKASKSAE